MKKITYGKYDNCVIIKTECGEWIRLQAVREDMIRCIYSKEEIKPEIGNDSSFIIETGLLDTIPLQIKEMENYLQIETSKVEVHLDLFTGKMDYTDKKTGRLLLKEGKKQLSKIDIFKYTTGDEKPVIDRVKTVDGERNFIKNLKEVKDHEAYRGKIYFEWKEEEGIYGLGQAEEGIYNYRHHNQYLYQHNMRIPMPMFFSDEGYGMLFNCCSLITFQDDRNGSYLFFDAVSSLDYYFVAGRTPDLVIDGFRYLTGKAAMLPRWAYGYVQSKEQYYTAEELKKVVKRYRELKVPLDCVVQDWNTWEPGNWGEKILDKKRFGDVKEQLAEIKKMNAHAMVSVWPNMNTGCKNHTEFFEAGYLLEDYSTYDAFQEKAREMYWEQAKRELFDGGFEAWWCDSTEPFSGPDWGGEIKKEPWERYCLVGGEHKRYLEPEKANAYALMHAKGIYENQRKTTEEIRVLNLTRSGYASGQKYAAVLWSGDTYASYDTLKKQIVEGINMGLSGYPYWTLDIGGFFTVGSKWQNRGCGCHTDDTPKWFWRGQYNEGVKDNAYKELYVRWLEMGTFLPMFRSHGTDTPREIWNFGERGTPYFDAIEKFIKLRYRLMPYIYSLAGAVYLQNATIMRSLLFDFMDDKKARKIDNEFLFGKSLLICPVTSAMYYEPDNKEIYVKKERSCYLPLGVCWYDFWSGEKYEGGQEIIADTPLDSIPVFVRAGSIISMKTGMQYADDKAKEPLELYLYPGANGEFVLYEDEGNNYKYEKGAYAVTKICWMEEEHTLRIQKREGNYVGMPEIQTMKIFIKNGYYTEICYQGEEITVLIPDIPED